MSGSQIVVGILTISDRASAGIYEDLSGPALRRSCQAYAWEVCEEDCVPDQVEAIQGAIRACEDRGCRLILTTGGTGVSPRDVTPEAIRGIMRVEIPGFGEHMRQRSLELSPHALLSRGLAAVVGRSLVLALPGKPKAAVECLSFVKEAIPHALQQIRGEDDHG